MMNVVELARDLVRIPSVSGDEEGMVNHLAGILPDREISGRNIFAIRGEGPRTLLLNSHIDTVPAGDGWSFLPHEGRIEGGKLFGLGATDAVGSLSALVVAFLEAEVPEGNRLVLAATCEEETGGDGLGVLLPELPEIDAAVIGEPTDLTVCTCQRGLLRLRLTARGKRAHAARPWQGENAIEKASRDVMRLAMLDLGEHDLLGRGTVQVTRISGGVQINVVPPSCTMEIDARSLPSLPNEELRKRIEEIVESEVELLSDRFVPIETSPRERIVAAALGATGRDGVSAFGGVSDLFHVRHVPGVIVGPGSGEQSHQVDEFIETAAIERGLAVYIDLISRYFG